MLDIERQFHLRWSLAEALTTAPLNNSVDTFGDGTKNNKESINTRPRGIGTRHR